MKEEVKRWIEQSKADMKSAKNCFKSKDYYLCAFMCQQAAEKSLKTLLLKRGLELVKTHDLVLLAKKLNAPDKIVQMCKELTPVYVETRYPDTNEKGFRKYTKKETEDDLKIMGKITKWAKKNL